MTAKILRLTSFMSLNVILQGWRLSSSERAVRTGERFLSHMNPQMILWYTCLYYCAYPALIGDISCTGVEVDVHVKAQLRFQTQTAQRTESRCSRVSCTVATLRIWTEGAEEGQSDLAVEWNYPGHACHWPLLQTYLTYHCVTTLCDLWYLLICLCRSSEHTRTLSLLCDVSDDASYWVGDCCCVYISDTCTSHDQTPNNCGHVD